MKKVQIYEKCCHVFALVVDVPIFGKATVGEVMNLSALPMAGNLQPVPQSYLVYMLNSSKNVLHKGAPMQCNGGDHTIITIQYMAHLSCCTD